MREREGYESAPTPDAVTGGQKVFLYGKGNVTVHRQEDKGKVRMTVIFNERGNKPHIRKHSPQRVTGLFNGDDGKFLDILVAEVKRFRPTHKVNTLRYLLEQALKAYHLGAG